MGSADGQERDLNENLPPAVMAESLPRPEPDVIEIRGWWTGHRLLRLQYSMLEWPDAADEGKVYVSDMWRFLRLPHSVWNLHDLYLMPGSTASSLADDYDPSLVDEHEPLQWGGNLSPLATGVSSLHSVPQSVYTKRSSPTMRTRRRTSSSVASGDWHLHLSSLAGVHTGLRECRSA